MTGDPEDWPDGRCRRFSNWNARSVRAVRGRQLTRSRSCPRMVSCDGTRARFALTIGVAHRRQEVSADRATCNRGAGALQAVQERGTLPCTAIAAGRAFQQTTRTPLARPVVRCRGRRRIRDRSRRIRGLWYWGTNLRLVAMIGICMSWVPCPMKIFGLPCFLMGVGIPSENTITWLNESPYTSPMVSA